jgi:hypothetical protein
VGALRQLQADGSGSLRIVTGPSHIRKVFSISGLDGLFLVFDSLAAAADGAPDHLIPSDAVEQN